MNQLNHRDGRREEILRALEMQQRVHVSRLAQRFGVSPVTIRGDLRVLEQAGLVQRQHGGATTTRGAPSGLPLDEKRSQYRERKHSIAARAMQLVRPGDKLILDAGSTTLQLAILLARTAALPDAPLPLSVFTNSLPIANELGSVQDIELLLSGGTLRKASQSLQGPQAEAGLEDYVFDKLFLGVDGCDPAFGLSTHDEAEARLNARMAAQARQVIVLADSSKFGRICLHRICDVNRVDIVVSDAALPSDMREALSQRGVEVLIAEATDNA
ncbi:transcriptional repressor AgaR [Duganella radicis]|uniref:DeoR family transcriptional regulator n=1 Tax=Duganella radicis TaxID=551988 RepID=A0A6L6PQ94_9BURK|nr:transcriptional repressor AgaR [Duganella radicis]MTV40969.1 DeoR family transcriptional regulator [Duganella radicis]